MCDTIGGRQGSTKRSHAPRQKREVAQTDGGLAVCALEPGKWVKVQGWDNADAARKAIVDSVNAYKG